MQDLVAHPKIMEEELEKWYTLSKAVHENQ